MINEPAHTSWLFRGTMSTPVYLWRIPDALIGKLEGLKPPRVALVSLHLGAFSFPESETMTIEKVTIGNATLYLGDCREVLPTLPVHDLLLTDPPYGIDAAKGKAHSSIRDSNAWEQQDWDKAKPPRWLFGLMLERAETSMIWGGNYFADALPAKSGWLVWRKPEAETGFSLADVELCWTSLDFAARTLTHSRRDGNAHPTQKPVAVIGWAMGFCPPFKTCLDPFMGSGTTGVACAQLGKDFTGIERERKYFDIACERIANAQAQGQLLPPQPPPQPVQEGMF